MLHTDTLVQLIHYLASGESAYGAIFPEHLFVDFYLAQDAQ
jgi:hypothetical protein